MFVDLFFFFLFQMKIRNYKKGPKKQNQNKRKENRKTALKC